MQNYNGLRAEVIQIVDRLITDNIQKMIQLEDTIGYPVYSEMDLDTLIRYFVAQVEEGIQKSIPDVPVYFLKRMWNRETIVELMILFQSESNRKKELIVKELKTEVEILKESFGITSQDLSDLDDLLGITEKDQEDADLILHTS